MYLIVLGPLYSKFITKLTVGEFKG